MENIQWSAPEYRYYEKHPLWDIGVGVIFGLIILFALWQKNFLFAVFMGIAAFLVASWGKRPPETTTFVVTDKGISIGTKTTYPYEKIEGFAILETPEEPTELILKTKEKLHGLVRIMVPEDTIESIKTFLLHKEVPEIEYEDSMSEHIGRMLKF